MKTTSIFSPALLLGAFALISPVVYADESTHVAASDTKMAEMIQKAELAGKPGTEHELLAKLAGNWSADVKCWMPGNPEAMANKASSKGAMILGGRFLQEEFTGEFMGKPFHGISLTGYDNLKKKFVNIWLDDASTAVLVTEGNYDDHAQTLTFTGNMTCPTDGTEKPVKLVIKITDDNKHTFEMHDTSLGDKSKTMEITYTKK